MGGSNSVVEKPVAKYKTKKQNIDGIPKILSEPYIMNESSIGEGRFGYVRYALKELCLFSASYLNYTLFCVDLVLIQSVSDELPLSAF